MFLHEESSRSEACVDIPREAKDYLRWVMQPATPSFIMNSGLVEPMGVVGDNPPASRVIEGTMAGAAIEVSPSPVWLLAFLVCSDNERSDG